MAKLKAPLMSLGASGQLGKALVFFSWKGLNVVRQHIVPTNPNTQPQKDQRAWVTLAVENLHTAMAQAIGPLGEIDKMAYATWAGIVKAATTWFNQAVKSQIDQNVAGLNCFPYRGGAVVAADGQLTLTVYNDAMDVGGITDASFWYGSSKTALLNHEHAVIDAVNHTATKAITGLTNGTKYYIQCRPDAIAEYIGNDSGIYHGTPHA